MSLASALPTVESEHSPSSCSHDRGSGLCDGVAGRRAGSGCSERSLDFSQLSFIFLSLSYANAQ